MDKKTAYAAALSLAALADNASTWIALQAGAEEVNILVKPLAANPYLFALFTLAKTLLSFIIVHQSYEDTLSFKLAYFSVLLLFLSATALNALNAAALR